MATKSKAATKSTTGKRYSDGEKAEIIKFVEEFNAKNGRGGQTTAAKKYGVSQLTLATWLKANGTGERKSGSKRSGSSLTTKLASLAKLNGEIIRTEKELQALKAKFAALKASL